MLAYIVGAGAVVIALWVIKKKTTTSHQCPDLPGVPFTLTELYQTLKDPLASNTTKILENCKKYPKIWTSKFFSITFYVVSDPALLKEIMLVKTEEFANQVSGFLRSEEKILTSKSLISLKDDEWKERRRLLNPFFATTKITPMTPLFVDKANILCDLLSKVADKNEVFQVRNYTTAITLDILGEAVFGVNFDTQHNPDNPISKAVVNWIDSSQALSIIPIIPYWYNLPLKVIKDFFKGQESLTKICKQVTDIRNKPENRREDLLQSLVDAGLSIDSIISESLLFLVAGHETTSTTLAWAFYLISQHPEVEKKIVEEIETILKGEQPKPENVNQLKYLGAVIDETLRLYPPAVATTRQSSCDAVVDGIHFPKGSKFIIPIWALHHNEKYWQEPEKFIPERWLDKTKIVPNTYMPFGLGARMCIGFKFSLAESKVILSMVYQRFTLKYHEKTPPVADGTSLLRPKDLRMSIHRRV